MSKISKNSRLPLYHQLVDVITANIEEGRIKENEKIMSERELCEMYNISRATVRQAIQELEKNGYIYKVHGKGTYVSPRVFKQDLLKFYSFTSEMKNIGKVPSSKLLKFKKIEADWKVSRMLKCEEGALVYEIVRLRLADNEPMMHEITYLPVERFPELSETEVASSSMYAIFQERYSVVFSRAEERLKPVLGTETDTHFLEIDASVLCMRIERLTFEGDQIIEYTVGIARGDRFEYRVFLEQ